MFDLIPQTLTAGQSLSLSLSFSAHPASAGWALSWTLQGPGTTRVVVDGVADADAFTVALASADSLKLRGKCPWQLWASKGAVSCIVGAGVLDVSAGMAVTADEQILEALEAALLRLAADDEAEVEISDRKIVFKDPEKVQKMISVYRTRVRVARGGSPFTRIPVRFSGEGLGFMADPGGIGGIL